MGYALHMMKVVAGTVLTLVMYGFILGTNYLEETLLLGTGFILGLVLTIQGLLSGIEAAVAAGTAATDLSATE